MSWTGACGTQVVSALPDPILLPYVRRYVQRSFDLGATELVEPVVARLGAMLEFQFADPYAIPSYADGRPNSCPAVTIVGPITYRRVRLLIRGRVEALAILFQPTGLYRLFGIPTAPLTEVGTEAQAVLGPGVSRLHQRLRDQHAFADRVAILNRFLRPYVRPSINDAVTAGLQYLLAPETPLSVTEVARKVGLDVRQFQRKALDHVGVSPKLVDRIARFQRALRISERGKASLTAVAHDADYYDQSHMVREFRRMAGATPRHVIANIAADHLIRF